MVNVAHMDNLDKQRAAAIALDREQRKAMPTVHALQRLKSARILHVPTIYHVKSGNAAAQSR